MKAKYMQFCKKNYVPIYSKPWWMDAACGAANWDVFVVERGGRILAAMPFYLENRDDNKVITKARLTHNNGIIISYPPNQKQTYSSKLDFEDKIIYEVCDFIEALPISLYEQQYHHSFTNWLPFFWRGYKESTRYTYVIEDTSNMESILKNYSAEARNMLRKAQRKVKVVESEQIGEFYKLDEAMFFNQSKSVPYSYDVLAAIYAACIENGAGKILAAIDKELGTIYSMSLVVWDEACLYYVANATDPRYRNTQANTLLIHESIILAHNQRKCFDFSGSVIQPIEKAFRQFGGIRKPYFRITKEFNIGE